MRAFILFVCLLCIPVSVGATQYSVTASYPFSTIQQATPTVFSLSTVAPPFIYSSIPDQHLPLVAPFIHQPILITVANGGQFKMATTSGVTLVDAVTTSYGLGPPGTSFASSFSGFINPQLVGGISSHEWSGTFSTPLAGLDKPWTFQARTQLPEPSTLALMAPIAVGLWVWRRHRCIT